MGLLKINWILIPTRNVHVGLKSNLEIVMCQEKLKPHTLGVIINFLLQLLIRTTPFTSPVVDLFQKERSFLHSTGTQLRSWVLGSFFEESKKEPFLCFLPVCEKIHVGGARNLKAKPCDCLKSEHFKKALEKRIHETVNKYVLADVSKAASKWEAELCYAREVLQQEMERKENSSY